MILMRIPVCESNIRLKGCFIQRMIINYFNFFIILHVSRKILERTIKNFMQSLFSWHVIEKCFRNYQITELYDVISNFSDNLLKYKQTKMWVCCNNNAVDNDK